MPSSQFECSSRGIQDPNVLHDCDSTLGTSGSALLTSFTDDISNLPFTIALHVGENRGNSPSSLTLPAWDPSFPNYAKPMLYGIDQFLEVGDLPTQVPTNFPTSFPTPYPTAFPTTTYPTPFPGGPPSPTSCSTYPCPKYSTPKKDCTTKFRHCKCLPGYKQDNKNEICNPCNTYSCPSNSKPKSNKSCITKFSHCECDTGYEADKNNEKCFFCNTFTCPANSKPKGKKCITKFKHCDCNEGFKKADDKCIPKS
mmetsp:Transcript_214/g.315  ORF Transcript_214/g.315 Transcript_214/m.315 type:complete len:254 (+) Transcript_214:1-762(+)